MKKINKILIANRGEIVLRVIRTCQEMGIQTVALCPLKGQESNFIETRLADEYYFLNEEGTAGYLNQKKIIEIAKKAKVDAIHPGYGFLSENWKFAKLCRSKGIIFIGPHHKTLKSLEDKIEAKRIAKKAGIPTLPASDKPITNKKDLIKWIKKIQPPFILKAQKGGGGIGIRIIDGKIDVSDLLDLSGGIQRQMASAFSSTEFFIEKHLQEARHIEVQILGDGENVIHLGERECSIQRRFQKLFEESPSPFLNEKERKNIRDLAVKLAKKHKYEGAGTVEFLLDKDKNPYFLEVNPRLQVEHPVTEAVTGIDIVEQQIKIAQGEKLSLTQDDVTINGWAMEARINAEDPRHNFRPSPGTIRKYIAPGGQGIFLHTFLHEGQKIYPYFDSLLGKIISHGKDRKEAMTRLKRALKEINIEGVPTTIPFFNVLLENKNFIKGKFTTSFIKDENILEELKKKPIRKKTFLVQELDEEQIADIIFQVYENIKSNIKTQRKDSSPSNWVMAERLKMLQK